MHDTRPENSFLERQQCHWIGRTPRLISNGIGRDDCSWLSTSFRRGAAIFPESEVDIAKASAHDRLLTFLARLLARLAHDGFGFDTNFAGNLVGITLLEFRQEEFHGERAGVSFFRELAQNSSQRADSVAGNSQPAGIPI